MRAIPQNKKWNLYGRWVNHIGDILCRLNWHDEIKTGRYGKNAPQNWCRCCGKEYYLQDNKWRFKP